MGAAETEFVTIELHLQNVILDFIKKVASLTHINTPLRIRCNKKC